MLRSLTRTVTVVLGRAVPARATGMPSAATCSSRVTGHSITARPHSKLSRAFNSTLLHSQGATSRRFFSSGDDDDDGASTDFTSALEMFWSQAVQQQLQAAAAGLPAVQDNLSVLSPGSPEYVKQMRRVETLATLERMLQQLMTLEADALGMQALADEATASGDTAMKDEAQSACKQLAEDCKAIKIELLKFLVPHDDADSMDAILELRAGVGGGEAALWCSDMCSMYQRFCDQKGWGFEIVSTASTDSGGLREVGGVCEGLAAACDVTGWRRLYAPSAATAPTACCASKAVCIVSNG
jgi:hypothetical protein